MPVLASLVCGFVFGWGLTVSGMIQPSRTTDVLCQGPHARCLLFQRRGLWPDPRYR